MASDTDRSWERILERLRAATAGELIIGGELGRGGMGAVFLAYDRLLGRRVAIKVMAPELHYAEGLVERFSDEAMTMANLRHPNIVAVHSVRAVEEIRFFVMEYVAGRSLERILDEVGRLPLPVVRAIAWQAGCGLGHAHRRGITHRDVKPGNILVDDEGSALVTDFGIAKATDSSRRTHTGVLIGTPAYMSPEQCYGLPATSASDQYSLGIVVFEMLTGEVPFDGSIFTAMQGHTHQPVPPPRELNPDVPDEVERALLRMLAKSPDERWPSMREALDGLGAHAIDEDDPVRRELAALATLGEAPAATRDVLTPPDRRRPPSIAIADPEPGRRYLILSDPPASLSPGAEFRMTAVVCLADGTIESGRAVSWVSSAPEIARVEHDTGRVCVLATGEATLTVSSDDLVGGVRLAVGEALAITPAARRPDRTVALRIATATVLLSLGGGALVFSYGSSEGRLERTRVETQRIQDPVAFTSRVDSADSPAPAAQPTSRRAVVRHPPSAPPSVRPDDERGARSAPTGSPAPVLPLSLPTPALEPTPPLTMNVTPSHTPAMRTPTATPDAVLRAASERCARAVASGDAEQTAALVTAEGAAQRDLEALLTLLRDDGARPTASSPVYGAVQIGDSLASEQFEIRLSWRSSFGRARSASVTLRSLMRTTSSQWSSKGCLLVRASGLR